MKNPLTPNSPSPWERVGERPYFYIHQRSRRELPCDFILSLNQREKLFTSLRRLDLAEQNQQELIGVPIQPL